MYRLCMIATIPLATGNKLNCFISASGMLAIVWHCVLLFCCFFCVCFLLIIYMLINHLLKKKKKKFVIIQLIFLINHLLCFMHICI